MTRFEYLVVYMENDRVLTANGHWQGTVERGGDGDVDSCPCLHDYLSDAGAQGWEMVAIDPEETGTAQLYFKRAR
jgi:hypothetical protein